MSGGQWNYEDKRMRDVFEEIGDEEVKRRWPKTAEMIKLLGSSLCDVTHEMDWDLSGDTHHDDDKAFDRECQAKLLDAVLKTCPDEWFPRGKWGTIQAIQERTGANYE